MWRKKSKTTIVRPEFFGVCRDVTERKKLWPKMGKLHVYFLKALQDQCPRLSSLFYKNFLIFSFKPYGVTIHSNRLVETIRMNGHIIGFDKNKILKSFFLIRLSIVQQYLFSLFHSHCPLNVILPSLISVNIVTIPSWLHEIMHKSWTLDWSRATA